jgi:hypothetical protein
MYPLGLASPKVGSDLLNEEFYFLLEEWGCQGLEDKQRQTVAERLEDQGINEYNQMGEYFKELTLHDFRQFEVGDETRRGFKEDDVELLKFGYGWLRLALSGEKTVEIKRSVLEAKKKELGSRCSPYLALREWCLFVPDCSPA